MKQTSLGVIAFAIIAVSLAGGLCGCPPTTDPHAEIRANFETSLHATRAGKTTWWEGEEGEPGFSSLLPAPIIDGCVACHAATYADGTAVDTATYEPGCGDCHVDPDDPTAYAVDAPTICLGCHGRQAKEFALASSTNPTIAARFTDVHRDAGMTCNDCHTGTEIHGDGTAPSSMLESPSVTCESCHVDEGATAPAPQSSYSHDAHSSTLDCSACHVQTIISCYNCHIESLVDSHVKRAAGAPNGFMLLMNRVADGKVYPGSFQSATYDGNKMIALGGFFGHTITSEGRVCTDCHNNANLISYDATGEIVLGVYDEETQSVTGASGVVPVPPDYKSAVKLDFLNYDPVAEVWSVIGGEDATTPDLVQMAPSLVTPLTEAQMNKLRIPVGVK